MEPVGTSQNPSDTIDTGRPSFTKLAHDIKIYYIEDAQSWVINNEGENVAFAVSNAQSPSHIPSGLVFISFDIDLKVGKIQCHNGLSLEKLKIFGAIIGATYKGRGHGSTIPFMIFHVRSNDSENGSVQKNRRCLKSF